MFSTPKPMTYSTFKVLFPARAEHPCPIADIHRYDNGTYLAQPKLNGSNTLIYLNDHDAVIMNRHGERRDKREAEYLHTAINLHRGSGWMVVNGEYMDKSKKDENGNPFKGFVLFDILVWNGVLLTGTTFADRYQLLQNLYSDIMVKPSPEDGTHPADAVKLLPIRPTTLKSTYIINSFTESFQAHYDRLIQVDMYEGLVLKKKNERLMPPFTPTANGRGQIKFRKPTKNYQL